MEVKISADLTDEIAIFEGDDINSIIEVFSQRHNL